MCRLPRRLIGCGTFLAILAPLTVLAADSKEQEVAAIRLAAANYVKASTPARSMRSPAAWTADGDYIDAAGHSFKARDLIARVSAKEATGGHVNRHITVEGIRLRAPDVAIEDGRIEHPAAGEAAQAGLATRPCG